MEPIQVVVCYPGAGSVAAILLAAAGNVIRVAMEGWADIAQFRLVGGQWLSEENEPVEIDSQPGARAGRAASPGAAPGLPLLLPPPSSLAVWVN